MTNEGMDGRRFLVGGAERRENKVKKVPRESKKLVVQDGKERTDTDTTRVRRAVREREEDRERTCVGVKAWERDPFILTASPDRNLDGRGVSNRRTTGRPRHPMEGAHRARSWPPH